MHFAFRGQQSTVSDCCSRSLARAPTHKTIRLHNVNSAYNSSSIVFNFQSLITLHVTINDTETQRLKFTTQRAIQQTTHFCSRTNHTPSIVLVLLYVKRSKTLVIQASRAVKSHTDFTLFPFSTYIIQ